MAIAHSGARVLPSRSGFLNGLLTLAVSRAGRNVPLPFSVRLRGPRRLDRRLVQLTVLHPL